MSEWGRGEWRQHNLKLLIIANLFFIEFQKRHKISNQIFQSISKEKSYVAVLKNLIAVFCYPLVSKFMRCLYCNKHHGLL